jgi:hypothetical protein
MKFLATSVILFAFAASTAFAQSKSYQALREKFRGEKEVVSLHTSGGFARTILWLAGERDFKEAIEDVKDIRFTVIPKKAFRAKSVSLDGFKKVAKRESFEELARVKDHGDDVTLLMQTSYKQKHNRYLLLVESDDEVVVMEIRGYIDPSLSVYKDKIAYN